MSELKRALLIVGSPKPGRSSSLALGEYLLAQLALVGVQGEVIKAHKVSTPEEEARLLATLDASDLVIIAAPLYVDSLPSQLIRLMERVADHPGQRCGRLLAIVNCGFPEGSHNRVALDILERFASNAGFDWAGGLSLGMGAMVGGRPLHDLGGQGRSLRDGLDRVARELLAGQTVSDQARAVFGRPAIPKWAYVRMGNLGWRLQARRNKATHPLKHRPYKG